MVEPNCHMTCEKYLAEQKHRAMVNTNRKADLNHEFNSVSFDVQDKWKRYFNLPK